MLYYLYRDRRSSYQSFFIDLLQVALIVLKLCGVIDWEWWIVLLPLIVSLSLALTIIIVIGGCKLWRKLH